MRIVRIALATVLSAFAVATTPLFAQAPAPSATANPTDAQVRDYSSRSSHCSGNWMKSGLHPMPLPGRGWSNEIGRTCRTIWARCMTAGAWDIHG